MDIRGRALPDERSLAAQFADVLETHGACAEHALDVFGAVGFDLGAEPFFPALLARTFDFAMGALVVFWGDSQRAHVVLASRADRHGDWFGRCCLTVAGSFLLIDGDGGNW